MSLQRERLTKHLASVVATRVVSGVPVGLEFGAGGQVLYFTGQKPPQPSSSLYYVPTSPTQGASEPVEWRGVLEDHEEGRVLSKEEILLRERMRTTTFGITSFTYHSESRRFLIPASGTLYVVDTPKTLEDAGNIQAVVIPTQLDGGKAVRMDAKFNPSNSTLVSFIHEDDIWLVDTVSHQEKRLTFAKQESLTAGVAEFIMQEEFDRYTGYWWQPPSPQQSDRFCRILYIEVDEKDVAVFSIPKASDIEGKTDDYRYPLAGAKNATSNVRIVEFDAANFGGEPVNKVLHPPLAARYPSCEYVLRAGWFSSAEQEPKIWLQLLDRKQQHLQFITLDVSDFKTESETKQSTATDIAASQFFEERTSIWINVTDAMHFLSDGRLIWASEVQSNFRHLYLVDPTDPQHPRAITTGEWQVDTSRIWVDEKNSRVYFVGTKDSPIEAHLYVASFAENADPTVSYRLTPEGHFNSNITVSECNTKFASVYSNLNTPHRSSVWSLAWSPDAVTFEAPAVHKICDIRTYPTAAQPTFTALPPELFSFQNSIGKTAYGVYFKPPQYEEGRQYPTLLYVYGGPHVQLVTNTYSMTIMHKRFQLLASEGFVVVIIDGIGSWRRGLEWEGQLQHKMGQVEVQDQVLGIEHLIAEKKFIDRARIGVTGWSYGGYLSLVFLAQRPDFFKVSISGAPVTLWEAYDTGYTERYMDTPQNNPTGYARGSLQHYISGFPKEDNRLLIAHGLIDENVHFCNTAKLIDWLLEEGTPYQLQVYPSERHGVRSPKASLHWEICWLSFLHQHL